MEELNNPESDIYITTLENQKRYIDENLPKSKNRFLMDECLLVGDKETIAKHLNLGPAQNIVLEFFKFKTEFCCLCKHKRGENGIRQLERAHCHRATRPQLIMMSINDLWVDKNTPIKVMDILKLFIRKHEHYPIYYLCNICHKKYDH